MWMKKPHQWYTPVFIVSSHSYLTLWEISSKVVSTPPLNKCVLWCELIIYWSITKNYDIFSRSCLYFHLITMYDSKEGGWGWLVTAASFLIHVIVGGIGYSCGVWQMIFTGYFGKTRYETAWIGSTLLALTAIGGKLLYQHVSKSVEHELFGQYDTIV